MKKKASSVGSPKGFQLLSAYRWKLEDRSSYKIIYSRVSARARKGKNDSAMVSRIQLRIERLSSSSRERSCLAHSNFGCCNRSASLRKPGWPWHG